MEWVKDKVIMGVEKWSMVIIFKEKEMIVYYEVGYVFVVFFNK